MPPGRWICVDGTEGAGKTTVASALCRETASIGVAEFSRAPFGTALREAVARSPHFISTSPVGQSLVFLGDFIELYEDEIAPRLEAGQTVITDRGWLTKLAYQQVVLERVMTTSEALDLLTPILAHIPRPDLTLLLSAPAEVIRRRLIDRDGQCDEARLRFIERAATVASEAASTAGLDCVRIDTDRAPSAMVETAAAAVAGLVALDDG